MMHGENKQLAHDLFVEQQMTFDEIAARTGRSEKTVRSWAEEGKWKEERERILSSRILTHERLHVLVEKLTERMISDCEGENEISPQSLHALTNLTNAINKLYEYEGSVGKAADGANKGKKGLSEEALRDIDVQSKVL